MAASKWKEVGLALGFLAHELDEVEKTPTLIVGGPQAYFREILRRWLNRAPPNYSFPTMAALVEALRASTVKLDRLAYNLEQSMLERALRAATASSQQATTRLVTPASQETAVVRLRRDLPTCSNATAERSSVQEIRETIKKFEARFRNLKSTTIQDLDNTNVEVSKVVYTLTTLYVDDMDEHAQFLESHMNDFRQSKNHYEVFGCLNFYWNYLTYYLLDHLIQELSLTTVQVVMKEYKQDLCQFRESTPLKLFCQAQGRQVDPPPGFREIALKFEWPKNATLQAVELFRKEYASQYGLRKCALMLAALSIGSFHISWFVPKAVVKSLHKVEMALELFLDWGVTWVDVAGHCVYCATKDKHASISDTSAASDSDSETDVCTARVPVACEVESEEVMCVEQPPSRHFFCRVMREPLLAPHLTECCGKYISDEAVTKTKAEKGACPFCRRSIWNTMLDKKFQRQVRELRVFCSHRKSVGCTWIGELSSLKHHLKSCSLGEGACPYLAQAPRGLRRGAATIHLNLAYFTPANHNSVYRYSLGEDKWQELPPCPYRESGLAVLDGEVTAIGGCDDHACTDKVFTLSHSARRCQWVEKYPPMPTARSSPAVVYVCDDNAMYVVAIGGSTGSSWFTTVELFTLPLPAQSFGSHEVGNGSWCQLASLPQPLALPSATLLEHTLYVIGYYDAGFSRSLRSYLQGDGQTEPHSVLWARLPELPVQFSTAASLQGKLAVVGGVGSESSIHLLVDGAWVSVGSLATRRSECMVVNRVPDEMVVVGGYGRDLDRDELGRVELDSVELAVPVIPTCTYKGTE